MSSSIYRPILLALFTLLGRIICGEIKHILQNVDLEKGERSGCGEWVLLATLSVENRGRTKQTAEHTAELSFQESISWSETYSIGAGATVEVQGTLPWAKIGIKVSASLQTEKSWTEGEETTKTVTESTKVSLEVEGQSKQTVYIQAEKIKVVARYTGNLVTEEDGIRKQCKTVTGRMAVKTVSGGRHIRIVYGESIPLSQTSRVKTGKKSAKNAKKKSTKNTDKKSTKNTDKKSTKNTDKESSTPANDRCNIPLNATSIGDHCREPRVKSAAPILSAPLKYGMIASWAILQHNFFNFC